MTDELRKPQVINRKVVQQALKDKRSKAETYYNKGTRHLHPLNEHGVVRMRREDRWEPVKLMPKKLPYPRSYEVQTEAGRVLRRNRKFLLQTKEKANTFTEREDEADVELHNQGPVPMEHTSAPGPPSPIPPAQAQQPVHGPRPPACTRPRWHVILPGKFKDFVMVKP
jgi:hypothetical protein